MGGKQTNTQLRLGGPNHQLDPSKAKGNANVQLP
jgi:hypothetical protein